MLHRDKTDFFVRMFAVVAVLAFLAFPLTDTIVYLFGTFQWPVSGTSVSGRKIALFLSVAAGLVGVWKLSGVRLPSFSGRSDGRTPRVGSG